MRKIFANSFRLRHAYKVNGIIWAIKGIPLIGKLLPTSLYANRKLKTFANILGGMLEIVPSFLGTAIYFIIAYNVARSLNAAVTDTFVHIFIFTTIIGGFLNTRIFEPTKDKYYAIFLMRMNAKAYTLVDYLYFMMKVLVTTALFSPIFVHLLGASWITCFTLPVYIIVLKLCFTSLILKDCENKHKSANENNLTPVVVISVIILLAAAFVPPYFGMALPEWTLWALTGILLIPAIFAVRYIVTFNEYRPIYKDLLKAENYIGGSGKSSVVAAQQIAMQKKITVDMKRTSNKKGYKYFNELFIKRHARLLVRAAKRIALVAAVVFLSAIVALHFFPDVKAEVNDLLLTYLPWFLFIMYLINSGRIITQAMFMNCDHSMLTFRFYRQPQALLTLFMERLKYVILINLVPASVIALGLPALLFVSGGTSEPLNYVVLFVSIIAMSIFFSVHNMVLYYLLQPYNVNLEKKSATYSILNWVTYLLCYMGIQFQLPTIVFGSVISAFCIIYAVVAAIFAYRLAPKTFKLRN